MGIGRRGIFSETIGASPAGLYHNITFVRFNDDKAELNVFILDENVSVPKFGYVLLV